MIKILDTTLREGEQAPGVKFTLEQKIEIARMLDEFGIDYIEAGMPAISDEDKNKMKAVVGLGLKAEIVGLARAKKEDIDAVKETGAQRVKIFCGINENYLKINLNGRTMEETLSMITDSICYAKSLGLKVTYSIEDFTRTIIYPTVVLVFQKAAEAKVDSICLADTIGVAPPSYFSCNILSLKGSYVEFHGYKGPLEVHCHNDLGLALANSIDAATMDTDVISCSVNGLGERAGITSLAEFCLFLYKEKDRLLKEQIPEFNYNLHLLPNLSQKVAECSGIRPDSLRPIIGKNAFTHTAHLHQRAVKINTECYKPFDPAILGRERSFG